MSNFRIWFEFQSQKEHELKQIWDDVFNILVGGLDKTNAISLSLDDIDGDKDKAGNYISNKLSAVFERLKDPKFGLADKVTDVTQWLGQSQAADGNATAPKRKVEDLLKKLFGEELFYKFYSADPKSSDVTKKEPLKAPQQPPNGESESQPSMPPEQPMPSQPSPEMPGQQPQMSPQMPGAPPTGNPMPPKPPGFEKGLF